MVAVGVGGGYALLGFSGMTGSARVEVISVRDADALAKSLRARGMNVELSGSFERSFFSVMPLC